MVGISPPQISRIEHGQSRHVAFETLAQLAAGLGLDLSLRAYPNGSPVRDAAQLALLARFRAALPRQLKHRTEVPVGPAGDLRAWDDVVFGASWSLPVEAETRLRDVQALNRRLALKQRDGEVPSMLLVVADTRHNRHVLRIAADEFADRFPVRQRDAMAALARCQKPAGSSILIL
jgi:transcriptional regulator with XRE-family HTH domain